MKNINMIITLSGIAVQFACGNGKFSGLKYILARCRQPIRNEKVQPRPNDRNISTQHIATLVGTTCCSSLKISKFFGQHLRCCMMLYSFGHIRATLVLLSMHTSLIFYFKAQRESSNMPQRITTGWQSVEHFLPNNVVICCVEMLGALGQPLHNMIQQCCDMKR